MNNSHVKVKPNANIQILSNSNIHNILTPEYIEYRRRWMENPTNFIVEDFPIHLDIESTNLCNLKCTFCDKTPYLNSGDFGLMPLELFTKIIDEGSDKKLSSLKLSYRGEPLIHPKLVDMVCYAKKKGVLDVYFNTNAMLLNERKIQELIDAGLDRVSVSIEGVDKELFERERIGAKFDTIKNNLACLINMREHNQVKYPRIRIQTVDLPGINHDQYASYWSSYSDETAVIDYKEAKHRCYTLIDNSWACPQLWQRMTIEWNGVIMPCNNDDYRFLSPGNVKDISVSECWVSPIVQRARSLHMEGKSHDLKSCNGCPWRTTQIMKIRA
ncbi:MAG: radical SAM protein [Dissulfurispiraceae bacterium]|jgi:MoaA/NifB/PqqE/SkfB family radical SAM enzyme|nr:radical SAM protein [Dissulfurispiraceae bacterium]